jgi:uncharacterized protein
MSLRDQMLKAGLITEEQAKRAAHKQRVDKKRSDPKERAQQKQAAEQEVRRQQEAERQKHREQSREQQVQQAERQQGLSAQQHRAANIAAAYRDGSIASWEGARRYCYAVNGRIEWLLVSDDVGRKLEAGQAAIVAGERNPQRHIVLLAGGALKLRDVAPERVLVLHAG